MPTLALLFSLLVPAAPPHAGHHGNPEDLARYIAAMEDPSRDAWQKPADVIRALALQPGQVACDVGAGPGYFTLRLADAVGPAGRVYAVDVEPQMLRTLAERLAARRLTHVTPVLGLPADPLLPRAACDVILVVDTFHHFDDRVDFLRRLVVAARPGARLVVVDYHKRPLPVGPPPERKLTPDEVKADALKAGWKLAAEQAFLPHQYFLVFRAG